MRPLCLRHTFRVQTKFQRNQFFHIFLATSFPMTTSAPARTRGASVAETWIGAILCHAGQQI